VRDAKDGSKLNQSGARAELRSQAAATEAPATDKQFFLERPWRRTRIRVATPPEQLVAVKRIAALGIECSSPEWPLFVVVRQVAPGEHRKWFFRGDLAVPLPEDEINSPVGELVASAMWDAFAARAPGAIFHIDDVLKAASERYRALLRPEGNA
jgi:hypothetical protein